MVTKITKPINIFYSLGSISLVLILVSWLLILVSWFLGQKKLNLDQHYCDFIKLLII